MSDNQVRILMLEDISADAELSLSELERAGLDVECVVARSADEFRRLSGTGSYDIVLSDYYLPGWNGVEAYRWVRSSGFRGPFILVTATLDDEHAIECVKEGITDYVLKDQLARLPITVERALKEARTQAERDRAEQELRESERQYRLLFDANPSPMWVFSLSDLRFIAVNEAAIREYGYSREEFLSMRVTDIRPAEDVPAFLTQFPRQFAATERRSGPRRHRRKDGSIMVVNIVAGDVSLGDRQARLVMAQDVTAKLQTERELLESRERLRLLLDSTAEAIYGLDVNGLCTFCNSAAFRTLGYESADDLLGNNLHGQVHYARPDGSPYPEAECPISQSYTRGMPAHAADEVYWRRDGTKFPVEYWSHPIIQDGRTVGTVVTFFDVTAEHEAQAALKRSEHQYRSAIEGAPYGIYRVDLDGSIRMVNPALAKMLGYESEAELLALGNSRSFYGEPGERADVVHLCDENDKVLDYETRFRSRSGAFLTVRLAARVLRDDAHSPYGYEVFVENITEQRVLQRQLEEAQKMEAIGQLAGGVAHDFNNLLMIIGSCAQALGECKDEPEQVAELARQIEETGNRAVSVIRQLLAFSRRQVLQPVVLDLNAVVFDLLKMLPRFLGEDIEVPMSLSPTLGKVRADRGQIEQVILNLAVNARDAMPRGGKLTIATANAELDEAYARAHDWSMSPGPYVMLSISDTGVGMDPETKLRIFEPFFTTKEPGKGTGLGLSTVYGIVKQSGGFVWVYSEPGHGTSFRIYFPRVAEEQEEIGDLEAVQPVVGGSETLLLVEDEVNLLSLESAYLQSKGYRVLSAGTGAEAIQIGSAERGRIHAIITDMVMPGMTGPDMAKHLLATHPDAAVIYMSGYSDRAFGDANPGKRRAFLQKPFSFDTLARTLRIMLSEERTSGPSS